MSSFVIEAQAVLKVNRLTRFILYNTLLLSWYDTQTIILMIPYFKKYKQAFFLLKTFMFF